MSWISSRLTTFIGWAFICSIFYFLVSVSIFVFSVVALNNGIAITQWPFNEFQRYYYFGGGRAIWQSDASCVQVDEQLIYRPKNGVCSFTNPEFKTTLSFDESGRFVPSRMSDSKQKGVAILGDSQAMGWGVNDSETFANVLQEQIEKPVYNLAVSSYGTERELKRFALSGLVNKVDTIIIQYCDNDIGENLKSINEIDYSAEAQNFSLSLQAKKVKSVFAIMRTLKDNALFAANAPFRLAKAIIVEEQDEDFTPHYDALKKVIKKYQNYLDNKQVFILYSNGDGKRFRNFPSGLDVEIQNLFFVDITITKDDHFLIDDHLTAGGHKKIGLALAGSLKNTYMNVTN
jgi:lysophospholipase L1-like esterase